MSLFTNLILVLVNIACCVGFGTNITFHVSPTMAGKMCPPEEVDFQSTVNSAIACAKRCSGKPSCRSLIYVRNNHTCFGIRSEFPFSGNFSPLAGAVFYQPGTASATTTTTTTSAAATTTTTIAATTTEITTAAATTSTEATPISHTALTTTAPPQTSTRPTSALSNPTTADTSSPTTTTTSMSHNPTTPVGTTAPPTTTITPTMTITSTTTTSTPTTTTTTSTTTTSPTTTTTPTTTTPTTTSITTTTTSFPGSLLQTTSSSSSGCGTVSALVAPLSGVKFSSTSRESKTFDDKEAKLNNPDSCWSAAYGSTTGQYIQVDITTYMQEMGVTEVITQGNPHADEWVTSYTLSYSDCFVDMVFVPVLDGAGQTRIFSGNTDRSTPVSHVINPPAIGNCFRLHPVTTSNGRISLRFELMGCGHLYTMK